MFDSSRCPRAVTSGAPLIIQMMALRIAANGEKRTGSNRAELPIPPFWSEARLAIRTAAEIRFVIPRQSQIALRELSPIVSLCDRSHAVLAQRLAKTNPPRPTRLRRSKRRVRCSRESSWHWPMQPGRPFHKFKMLKMKKVGRDQGMKLTML